MTAQLALVVATSFGVPFSAQQPPPTPQQSEPYRAAPGIEFPTPVRSVQPKYTPEAIQARVKGVVELEVVVSPTGTVGDVRVTKSLDTKYGLDQQAIEAAKQWVFRPGMKDGRAVPVLVTIIIEFHPAEPALAPVNIVAGDNFYKDAYSLLQPQLVQPTVVRAVEPKYVDATQPKLRGVVEVEAIVNTDGGVSRARVTQSLDRQCDKSALEAVKAWTFEPGRLNDQPVPVVVKVRLEFPLH